MTPRKYKFYDPANECFCTCDDESWRGAEHSSTCGAVYVDQLEARCNRYAKALRRLSGDLEVPRLGERRQ